MSRRHRSQKVRGARVRFGMRSEAMKAGCSADSLRRALKRMGAVWLGRGGGWCARGGPLLAGEVQRAAMRSVEPVSALAAKRPLRELEKEWSQRLLARLRTEFERVLVEPGVRRPVRWGLLRAAFEIAREGTSSTRASFRCFGRRTIPGGRSFSCDWLEEADAVAAAALVVRARPELQVRPGDDFKGERIYDATAPVPSAYGRLAQGILVGGKVSGGWAEALVAGMRRCSEQMAAEVAGEQTDVKGKQQALEWLAHVREECAEQALEKTLEKLHPVTLRRKEAAWGRNSPGRGDTGTIEGAGTESSGVDEELPW